MKDLEYYVSLPWTIRRSVDEREGCRTELILEIEELPGFVLAEHTEAELLAHYRPALECFLESYLEDGEVPPVPEAAPVTA